MSLLRLLASYRFSRYVKLTVLLWDLVLLNAGFLTSLYLRHGNTSRLAESETRTIWLLANVLWIALVLYMDAYALLRVDRIEKLLMRTIRMLLIHIMSVALFLLMLDYDHLSRLHLFFFYLAFGASVAISRVLFLKSLKYARSKGYNFRRIVVIGTGNMAVKIAEVLESDISFGFRLLGFFGDRNVAEVDLARIIGPIAELEPFLQHNKVHEIYMALRSDRPEIIRQTIFLAEKYMVRIKFIPNFYSYTKGRHVNIDFYGHIPVMMVRKEPLELPMNRLLKKLFDMAFSLAVIVLIFSWLFPILIVLVKMSSRGPVFFRQLRTGEDNHEFICMKFRTMRVNDLSDELQATSADPRITTVGKLMRKTNLDELPQFFNVLTGSMSVVGPRPHMLKHTEQYSALIDNYLVRHFAKPGITGWAQVNGYRGETKELIDMEKRVEYDIWYIENWSFLLDLKIIWRTVWNMVRGEKNAV
ncbi:MAG: undecaprenyl-phosphate glucose phosphotransferase [Flavobacteriales bacterium]|nr:undecaprenyl-phosphate glucose phosphotransferase [Flavobacteriales bacterium]